MVAPLRDLMDRQIFSETEIKAIVSRRRESEYLLRRRTARKADFLRYIEAEMNLEKLRNLRSIKRKRELKRQQAVDYTMVLWQPALNLMGFSENTTLLEGDAVQDEQEFLNARLVSDNRSDRTAFAFSKPDRFSESSHGASGPSCCLVCVVSSRPGRCQGTHPTSSP